MFMYNTEMLTAKYSLGSHPDEMIEDYLNGIEYLENVVKKKYGILTFCGCYR